MKLARSFISVAVSIAAVSAISMIGGISLDRVSEQLILLTPLVIAIPSLTSLVGDYSSIIAAHMGDPKERRRSKKALAKSVFFVLLFNITAVIGLSLLLAKTRGFEGSEDFVIRFIFFIMTACFVAVGFMFLLAHFLDVLLRKKKVNPDELLIPIVTSLADIVMLVLVSIAIVTIF